MFPKAFSIDKGRGKWFLICCQIHAIQEEEITVYRFLIVIEKANGNYSAYSPDLLGCVATGKTVEETERNMHEAMEMHITGLLEDGLPIPEQQSFAEFIAVC